MTALDRGWYGLENLSLIPGSTGAGPMQNIGAYGVELEEYFHALEAVEVKTGAVQQFSHGECAFGYRESVFKRALKGQFAITSVTFRLSEAPELRLGYGAIRSRVGGCRRGRNRPPVRFRTRSSASGAASCRTPLCWAMRAAFSRTPWWAMKCSKALKAQFPEMPQYPTPGGVKLAAGWLIDQAGWKGHDRGTLRGA